MGPRIFIRGNRHQAGGNPGGERRFNGATDFHPWKSIRRKVSTLRKYKLQWGHGFSSVEIAAGGGERLSRSNRLQWGHGFSSVEISAGERGFQTGLSFNGATDFHPWKSIFLKSSVLAGDLLQWGHGFSSVEIRWKDHAHNLRPDASMGPRILLSTLYCRWVLCQNRRAPANGHRCSGFSSVEISNPQKRKSKSPKLQWGHGFSSVEIPDSSQYRRYRNGFNGATDFHPWKWAMRGP